MSNVCSAAQNSHCTISSAKNGKLVFFISLNAGRNLYEVEKLLGHTQMRTTMRYSHLADETLAEAVNTVPLGKVV